MMKAMIIYVRWLQKTVVFFCITLLVACNNAQQVRNIEAFTHAYGLIRWFEPSDNSEFVEWDNFALYGIHRVIDCRNDDELRQTLTDLFADIAPTVSFSSSPLYQLDLISPPDTSNMSVVSWQHYGVDLGLWSNIYTSKRINRPLKTDNVSKLAIEGICPISDFVGKTISISIDVKNDSPTTLNVYFKAAVDRSGPEDYVSFCVADTLHSKIDNRGSWETYVKDIYVDSEDINSLLRLGIYAEGDGDFLIKKIKLNGDLIQNNTAYNEYWNSNIYEYKTNRDGVHISTKNKVFEEQNNFGDVVTTELLPDYYIHVPLALYATKESTYPNVDRLLTEESNKKMQTITYSNREYMLADLVVVWNVIKYFHPYLSDQHIVWDRELSKSIKDVIEYGNIYSSKPIKYLMSTLNDAHVSVNLPKDNSLTTNVRYLPITIQKAEDCIVIKDSFNPLLQKGDTIIAVNNTEAKDSFNDITQELSGSPQYKNARAEILWLRTWGTLTDVKVDILRCGKLQRHKIPLMDRNDYIERMQQSINEHHSRWINSDTLYLNLANTNFGQVKNLLDNRTDNQTVLIDIRDGVQFHLQNILPLISQPQSIIPARNKISHIPHTIRPESPIIIDTLADIKPRIPNKHNVFLVGAFNYSHHEEVLDYVRYAGIGCLAGSSTAGCNGRLNVITTPSGGQVGFTGTKVLSNLGKSGYYYGVGIKPDICIDN